MIGKIKGVMEFEKHIEELHDKTKKSVKQTKEHADTIKALKDEISSLKCEVAGLRKEAAAHNQTVSEHAKTLSDIKQGMEDELYELKLLKQNFQKKLIDELSSSFKAELHKQTERLDTDISRYNSLKDKLEAISGHFDRTVSEIGKFNEIAGHIKKADFTLVGHAKELEKADVEKLRLMRENDRLQKLISSERRRRN